MALGVAGFRVGCWTHEDGHTGCTVVLAPNGALGAAAVRGGAPGTREMAALGANGNVQECHAVVLSGGSAFGLATADGVVDWCETHSIGYDRFVARIPIVGAAIVFDLRAPGAPRPGRDAGWAACEAASEKDPEMGAVGVGAGCTAGKTAGLQFAVKSGQGWAVAREGDVSVGALVAVNPLGDVLDERGEVLLGSRAPAGHPRYPAADLSLPTRREPFSQPPEVSDAPTAGVPVPGASENTVIGCLVTNARLEKHQAARAADLAHSGIARAITPAHTSYDGDALFLLCAQERPTPMDLVAHLGAQAVAAAIRAAARAAGPLNTPVSLGPPD
ncbi:MAG: peptidase S58 family protein [Nitriliruptorales bacterium]|nr:peptidase S58 family protein [Nitriliruptorales bacterium]